MADPIHIGFLGAGKMAGALAKGFLNAGLVSPETLYASDIHPSALETFQKETGGKSTKDNSEVARRCSVLVLAVKPGHVSEVLKGLRPQIKKNHLLLSIAAGITLARLEADLPKGSRVIRVMPNTPALVGASATGFSLGSSATEKDANLAQTLFGAVGVAFHVKEALLDAVTGLSGSGPAYAYVIIEALSDGGVAAGLPREVATRLAAQTLLGSARMVLESGQHPGALKDMVTSPAGTTIEGLHQLEKGGLRGILISAVRAAADRARQLGQG